MSSPPRFAIWILRACVHPADRDEVIGDLSEMHTCFHSQHGPKTADVWFWYQVSVSAPRFILQSFAWKSTMLKNYLKLTIRTLTKQKMQGVINIAGLTIGIALCLLIMLFVRDEMTYDQFHAGHENIYQMQDFRYQPDGSTNGGNSNGALPLGQTISDELGAVEDFTRIWSDDYYVRTGTDVFREETLFVDPAFLDIFSFPLIAGDAETALSSLSNVVLTESAALRLFGKSNAVGETLEIRVGTDYQVVDVAAVAVDPPGNSTLQFAILAPIETWIPIQFPQAVGQFGWSLVKTFVQLRSDVNMADLNESFNALYASKNGDYLETLRERAEYPDGFQPATYRAVPLTDVYLTRYSDPSYSYILSAIGLAILLIACINFMTLAIGRSLSRSKEVGIRKSVGALRGQLIGQFWGEALFMTFLSTVLGLLLAFYALPIFNDITGKELTLSLLDHWSIPLGILGIIVIAGLISGSYPALVLSSFRPVDVLKNRLRVSGSNLFTRSLVTLQFTLSVCLIIGTLVMRNQVDFLRNQDRGFQTDQIVIVNLNGLDGSETKSRFSEQLRQESGIAGIALASSSLGYRGSNGYAVTHEGSKVNIDVLRIDHSFLDVMDISMDSGRSFDAERPADSSGVALVNQAFVNRFAMSDPIGDVLPGLPPEEAPTVIGVTPDFKYQSLYQNVGPLMITMEEFQDYRYMYVRLGPGNMEGSIAKLDNAWKAVTADVPFQFEFLDDRMARVYARDLRWARIINIASGFAIFLALLGLLGLTSLSVQSRTKEIGIRKVLGASTNGIIGLITKDFALTILIGAALAVPLAYIFTDRWLSGFAFQTEVGPLVYLLGIGIVLASALLTIVAQSFRGVRADAVDSLRSE